MSILYVLTLSLLALWPITIYIKKDYNCTHNKRKKMDSVM